MLPIISSLLLAALNLEPCLGIPKCSPLFLGIAGVGRFLGFLGSNVRARNSWCLVTTAISWEQRKHPPYGE